MRKLLTLSDDQEALAQELMKETLQDSYRGLLVFLMVNYRQNAKRPPGRPRKGGDDDANDNPEWDVPKFQAPDYPMNKTPYTYNEIVAWHEYDIRRGPAPDISECKLHPKWNEG